MTTKSKIIHTPDGTFIVDEDTDLEEVDLQSMVSEPELLVIPEKETATLVVNGETFQGHLKTYSVTKNHVTGKTTVKVVLVGAI